MKLKVKITTGFRKDQSHTIDAEESWKVYRLFQNPDERAIFKSGLALLGSEIKTIEPDYHATMGWNSSHSLDDDDWNEIKKLGVDRKIRDVMQLSKKGSEVDDLLEAFN